MTDELILEAHAEDDNVVLTASEQGEPKLRLIIPHHDVPALINGLRLAHRDLHIREGDDD